MVTREGSRPASAEQRLKELGIKLPAPPELFGAYVEAVQTVCGRCHTTAVFLNQPRSWDRWNDVFADMTRRGANGTDEQLARVTTYFLENLTLVNVNSSPADELAWVLGVRDDVAQAIIARRQRQPFSNIAQLRAVPGVDLLHLVLAHPPLGLLVPVNQQDVLHVHSPSAQVTGI